MQVILSLRFAALRWLLMVVAILATVGGAAQLAVPEAGAFTATRQWTGAGVNGDWTNPANWGGTAPVAGEILAFPAGPTRLDTLNDFPAGTNFLQIVVSGSGYTLAGNRVNLTTGLTTSHSTGVVTVNLVLSGPGGVFVNGDGRVLLAGANTFDGAVRVNQGFLRVRDAAALGSTVGNTSIANVSVAGGGLEIEGSFDIAESITLDPSANALLHQVAGATVLSGPLNIPLPDSGVDIPGGASLTINGPILGSGLFRTGAGQLTINGSAAGYLDLGGGVTTVNGSVAGRIDLAPGATLDGVGSVGQVVAAGGLFVPGPDGPGVFTVNGDVELSSKTEFGVVIIGTGFSQLVTAGRPALGSPQLISDVEDEPPPPVGSVFMIIKNNSAESVLGTFKNLPEGAVYTRRGVDFRVSYVGGDGNDVTLTVLNSLLADLRVTVSTSPEPVAPGGVLTYTIVVTNDGPADATGVQLIAPVTDGVAFVSAQAAAEWSCTMPPAGSSGQLRCDRSVLLSGAGSTLTLVVRVDLNRTAEISPRIVVFSAIPDPLIFNNQAQAFTHVSGGPVTTLAFKRVLPMVGRDTP